MKTEVILAEIRKDLVYLSEGHRESTVKIDKILDRLDKGAEGIVSTRTSVSNLWKVVFGVILVLVVEIIMRL